MLPSLKGLRLTGSEGGSSSCGRRTEAKVAAKEAAITKLELSARVKEDLKTVALGTSKINYLDPRITVAWCGD